MGFTGGGGFRTEDSNLKFEAIKLNEIIKGGESIWKGMEVPGH